MSDSATRFSVPARAGPKAARSGANLCGVIDLVTDAVTGLNHPTDRPGWTDQNRRRRRFGSAVAAAALALGACSSQPEPPQPEVHPEWISCAVAAPDQSQGLYYAGDALTLPALGDSFTPVRAVLCSVRFEPRDDGGEDEVATEEYATEIEPLLAALRLPDAPAATDCEDEPAAAPWIALIDEQGRWIRPGLPKDGCGQVRPEVLDGVLELDWTRDQTWVLSDVLSPDVPVSGCDPEQVDQVWSRTRIEPGRDWPVPADLPFADGDVRLCVYRVADDQLGVAEPAGGFERGGVLTPGSWAAIKQKVLGTGPAEACEGQARRFAVLRNASGGGGEIHVELDGCQRVLVVADGEPGLATAGTALISLLDGSS